MQGPTALLSIGYNRGGRNKGLDVLSDPIADSDWAEVGIRIIVMQQDHELVGIRKRREAEGQLILDALRDVGSTT